jgi:hypothetical protein
MKNVPFTFRLYMMVFALSLLAHSPYAEWEKIWSDSSDREVKIITSILAIDKTIFIGDYGSGVFRSSDNGVAWALVDTVSTKLVNALAISATTLIAGADDGIFTSTNDGVSWTAVDSSTGSMFNGIFAKDNIVLGGTDNGVVFKSTDNGAHWTYGKLGTTDSMVVAFGAMGNTLVAGTWGDGIFLSSDNGNTWIESNAGLLDPVVFSFTAKGASIFAGAGRRGIYQSVDNGVKWVHIGLESTDLPKLAKSGDKIFVGTWGDGVFVSTDNGIRWTDANSGLMDKDIYSIAVHDGFLLVGTANGGVWRRPISEMPETPDTANIQPQQEDLLAHWSFDSVSSDNTTFYDVTGHGYDAVCTKELSTGQGIHDKALETKLTDYTFSVEKSYPDFSVPHVSIESWIYSDVDLVHITGSFYNLKYILSYVTFTSRIVDTIKGIAKGYAFCITDAGAVQFSMANSDSTWTACVGTSVLHPKTWYHVVGTYDGADMKVFVNGLLEKSVKQPNGYVWPDNKATLSCQVQMNDGTVRGWFKGKIDELKLYQSVLDRKTILSHYNTFKPTDTSGEINFGMKTTYGMPGDTIVFPVKLTTSQDYGINSCDISLRYDPAKVELLSLYNDSGIVTRCDTFDWKSSSPGSVNVAMRGLQLKTANDCDGELFRGIFKVKPAAAKGDRCWILIDNIYINGAPVNASFQNGCVIIDTKSFLYGDVTGDGTVDTVDMQQVLSYAFGNLNLPDADSALVVADVSGDGRITHYDGTLIRQYYYKQISSFPVEAKKPPVKKPRVFMKTAANHEHEIIWDLIGESLYGFWAGDFTLKSDLQVQGDLKLLVSGATMESTTDRNTGILSVAVRCDTVKSNNTLPIFRIILPPNDSSSLSIESAKINNGEITVEIDKTAVLQNTLPRRSLKIRVFNRALYVLSNDPTPATVTVWNLGGKRLLERQLSNGGGCVNLRPLSRGVYIYRLRKGPKVITERFVLSR